ncbi:MAG TPA: M1 family aminopeptidase, partial [Pyrinomonadaceae bacterium]|nr:M1 family aminopeptidase [Pyrinomonadaceae bacterium]
MLLRVLFFALLLTMNVYSQTPPIEPGVSQTLAKWRAAHYSNVRYKLNITLEKQAPLLKGEIEIRVNLTEEGARNDLILDWRTTQFANDKEKPYANVVAVNNVIDVISTVSKEHLIVPKGALKTGENFIKIRFASPVKTSGAAVTRYVDKEDGAEYVYSLFVPSDASTAFPVFDQPDLKAKFQLSAIAPKDWNIISNTEIKSVDENFFVDSSKKGLEALPKDYEWTQFEETLPISTYVFAFAAGEFRAFVDEQSMKSFNKNASTRFGLYVRKSQLQKADKEAKETFRLNREAVKYLETYFDFKFPFPKYDLVLIPEFPFGGMEHAGATFLRESSVIFPSEPTANDYISRANLIFHEAAHQWFGDTVTMKWFDDLWLKEGFAEFMAYKTLEKVLPEYNAWKAFYERNKPLAYLTDSTRGTTPIYQEILNLSAAKSAYGNIVYRKAPSFLRQAEFYLGEDKFQTAVRAFLKKHQFANAEWTDLVKEFETASNQDLKEWANNWVTKRGMPIISKQSVKGWDEMHGCCFYSFYQRNLLGDDTRWRQKIKLLQIVANSQTHREEKRNIFRLESVGPLTSILSADDGSRAPFIGESTKGYSGKGSPFFGLPPDGSYFVYIPNYQDYGYGIFLLDAKSRDYVLKNIQNEKDPFLRSMMWGTLWDSVREAELAPKEYVELALKNISVETDELTISTILNRVSTAMNYYLSNAQRDELSPTLENLLIEKMRDAPTLGQRITFYRA